MKRAILTLLFLLPLPACMEEGGEVETDVDAAVDVAERDQAPEMDLAEEEAELLFYWKPDSVRISGPGAICDSDQSIEPGCQHRVPQLVCGQGSSCNASPVSTCASRCNYGYVCTANCNTANKTWKSNHSTTCNNPAYLQYPVGGGYRNYHPGPDLKCGTADDPAPCSADGKNPGADGLCGPNLADPENADNY
jgi:hypothetical protein